MKKTIALGLAALVGIVVLAKTTNVFSYARTAWAQVKTETKRQVPTKFELERIRTEIASLDSDVTGMIRPVAEYQVLIERLRKDIAKTEASVDEKRKVLLAVTEDIKSGKPHLDFGGRTFPVAVVKQRVNTEFASFKQMETHLATQKKLLEAKETALRASQDQLQKVLSKKREYELRVAQLEAENETLEVSRIGTEFRFDSSRATGIEQSLQQMEDRIAAERLELEAKQGLFAASSIPLHDRTGPEVNVDAIRAHLEGTAEVATPALPKAAKTASNK